MKRLVPLVALLAPLLSAGCTAGPPRFSSPGNTTYFVDSVNGDDTHDGTSRATAWRSLTRVNQTLFAPGDTIRFKAGSRFSGHLYPKGSGSPNAPLVIDMYGLGSKPVIEAAGRYHEALLLNNQEYWEVQNLELTNLGRYRQKFRYGVRLVAWDYGTVHHLHLKNLFVHDVNGTVLKQDQGEGHGILWENGGPRTPSRFDDLRIEDCHLLRTDRNGICGYSENSTRTRWLPSLRVVIRNNLLEDIGGDGIKVWGCDGARVEHNRLRGANQRAPDYSAGIWPWSSDHTLIQFNEVSGVKGTRDGQAFDSDGNCHGTLFQYNYSHDNEGGFMLLCNDGSWKMPASVGNTDTTVRYNISQNDRARTFHITGPIKNARIYNNVFYVGKGLDVAVFLFTDYNGWADGLYAANNIIFAEGTARYSHGTGRNWDGTYRHAPGLGRSTNTTFISNVYYGNHVGPPQDAMALRLDPLLRAPGSGQSGFATLEGYKLKDNSPCIRAGVPIKDNGGRDFWGNRVEESRNPTLGAQER